MRLSAILKKHEDNPGSLITILQEAQKAYGYLSDNALQRISKATKIPMSEIYGVVTFYSQFHLEKRGRHNVRVCDGTACHVKGGDSVLKTVEKELGITKGRTTEDLKFTLETVACLGTCFLAPVMMIDQDYFGRLTSRKVETVLKQY
ncbi:MAG: NADH-quinone oxidoreductase subunit NuoE [Actinomycetota bacterium]